MEKKELHATVLFDSFTPDLDTDKLRGTGDLSGEAIKRAMTLGYLKRANLMEIYEEMIDREKSLIISALKFQHPELTKKLDELVISFTFAEPFGEDARAMWTSLSGLYGAGLVSLETAVEMLALTKAPQEEIDRIKMAQMEKLMAEQELKAEQEQQKGAEPTEEPTNEE